MAEGTGEVMAINRIEGKWFTKKWSTEARTIILDVGVLSLFVDGFQVMLEDSLKAANHSPTGFNIGYGGSGPAQTALGILLAVTHDKETALRFHQDFKWQFIAPLKQNEDFLLEVDVLAWIERQRLIKSGAGWTPASDMDTGTWNGW